jgi:hypothetical protein
MNQARFLTVGDLFDSYPSAAADVGDANQGAASLDFLRDAMLRQQWQAGISFCAYLLPRRVAVAWGCRSLRRMLAAPAPEDDRLLEFAEAWIDEPDEHRRRKALSAGSVGDPKSPATWVAMAAGWSGGSIVPEEMGYAPADPEKTAKAVRVALFIALSRLQTDAKQRIMTACLQDGIQLARGVSGVSN